MTEKKRILKLYSPHSAQKALHDCNKRFVVASWGRQSGKTTWALEELKIRAWRNPGAKYWFVSPTFAQSKIVYRRLVSSLWPCREILIKKNQTELRVKFINHAEIKFVSGEVFDNLRGETLNGVVIDEMRDQHPDLWPMVIRPMLSTTKGFARFIGTPNGFDHFYDLSLNASDPKMRDNWAFFKSPSTANPLFTKEEYESAQQTMSEAEFAQEILAEFRDLVSGKAYINFHEANLSELNPWYPGQFHPLLPIVLGADFNISPMAWTLLQNKIDDWHAFDEIWLKNSHTQEASKVFVEKILNAQSLGHRANPAVILCGDATAKSRQRAAAGQSDYDILKAALRDANITYRDETPDSNPLEKDRLNTVNAKLKDAKGQSHFTLNPVSCPNLKKDFDRVTWKKGVGTLDKSKDPDLTHASDGVGYPICAITPLKGVREIGKPRIIQRVL